MTLQAILAALFGIGIGLVLLFYGYRAFLVLLPVFGFFGGLWLGATATQLLFGEGFLATITSWVVGLTVGVVFSALSYLFYYFGVAVIAGTVAAGFAVGIAGALGADSATLLTIVGLVVGVIAAVLTVRYDVHEYIITALTALAGANAVALGALLLMGRIPLEALPADGDLVQPVIQDSTLGLIVWVALAVAGLIYQLRHDREFVFVPEDYAEAYG